MSKSNQQHFVKVPIDKLPVYTRSELGVLYRETVYGTNTGVCIKNVGGLDQIAYQTHLGAYKAYVLEPYKVTGNGNHGFVKARIKPDQKLVKCKIYNRPGVEFFVDFELLKDAFGNLGGVPAYLLTELIRVDAPTEEKSELKSYVDLYLAKVSNHDYFDVSIENLLELESASITSHYWSGQPILELIYDSDVNNYTLSSKLHWSDDLKNVCEMSFFRENISDVEEFKLAMKDFAQSLKNTKILTLVYLANDIIDLL